MRKGLMILPVFALLASCAPTVTIPPANSVTGYWKGEIGKYGLTATLSARINLTNTPNAGDFTGTGQVRGAVSIDNAVVSGNVNTGVLIAQSGNDIVTCKGNFKNNNEYNGDCTYNSFSAPLYISRQGD